MAVTDPSGHALLSDAAVALETDDYGAFMQHVELAEDLLGVGALTLATAADMATATRAVVRQINLQVQTPESVSSILKRERKGDQEREYAVTDAGSGMSGSLIDPLAMQLIATLDVSSGWSTLPSLRG